MGMMKKKINSLNEYKHDTRNLIAQSSADRLDLYYNTYSVLIVNMKHGGSTQNLPAEAIILKRVKLVLIQVIQKHSYANARDSPSTC
jgi:hypothetical protein